MTQHLKPAVKAFRGLAFIACLCTALAAPAEEQLNYYDLSDPRAVNLLGNVEKFHLPPGVSKMRTGQYIQAMADFEFVLNRFPNHPKALLLMGEASLKMNQPGKAQRRFEQAIELYPKTARTYMVYGIFLHKRRQFNDAVKQYTQSIELNPNSSEAHYNLGLAYLALKQYGLANEQAQIAYAQGYPLPGLRNKLKKVSAWRPLDTLPQPEGAADTSPANPTATPSSGE